MTGQVSEADAQVLVSDTDVSSAEASSDSASSSGAFSDEVLSLALRTPTLPPATHTQSYALGSRELLLVEPATPYLEEQRRFVEWARALAGQGRALRGIVITHHHPDHVGGAGALARELSLPLLAHPLTLERLDLKDTAGVATQALEEGQVLELGGPTEERWQVLHTPGHAPGHLCLFEPRLRRLVVGDMVASEGTILIEPKDGHMTTYLTALERLEGLGAALALPAHGAPISEPSALFRHYIQHRLAREAKVQEAVRSLGRATTQELVKVAYDDTPRAVWGLAELSLRAHLIRLTELGLTATDGEHHWLTT